MSLLAAICLAAVSVTLYPVATSGGSPLFNTTLTVMEYFLFESLLTFLFEMKQITLSGLGVCVCVCICMCVRACVGEGVRSACVLTQSDSAWVWYGCVWRGSVLVYTESLCACGNNHSLEGSIRVLLEQLINRIQRQMMRILIFRAQRNKMNKSGYCTEVRRGGRNDSPMSGTKRSSNTLQTTLNSIPESMNIAPATDSIRSPRTFGAYISVYSSSSSSGLEGGMGRGLVLCKIQVLTVHVIVQALYNTM